MTGLPTYRRALTQYLIGYGLSLVLTAAAFAVVWLDPVAPGTALTVLGVCGIAQVAVQLRFFLHIDLKRQSREDLQLILFTTLILLIMVGGTVWVLASQMSRMM